MAGLVASTLATLSSHVRGQRGQRGQSTTEQSAHAVGRRAPRAAPLVAAQLAVPSPYTAGVRTCSARACAFWARGCGQRTSTSHALDARSARGGDGGGTDSSGGAASSVGGGAASSVGGGAGSGGSVGSGGSGGNGGAASGAGSDASEVPAATAAALADALETFDCSSVRAQLDCGLARQTWIEPHQPWSLPVRAHQPWSLLILPHHPWSLLILAHQPWSPIFLYMAGGGHPRPPHQHERLRR
jgi:hypothetical protein